jgi:hypothetical protein
MPVRSWTAVIACLALTVAARASEPEDGGERIHGGLSAGVGLAYDAAGLRAEIGTNHLGLFGGLACSADSRGTH